MKHCIHTLFLFFVSVLLSCSPGIPAVPGPGPTEPGTDVIDPVELHVKPVTGDEMSLILADTITPPSNPMAPSDLSSYPTFEGSLGLTKLVDVPQVSSGYYCCIHLDNPLQIELDATRLTISDIMLLDNNRHFVRFDHPALESFHVGDRILLTGTPYNICDRYVGVTMYFIQSAQ